MACEQYFLVHIDSTSVSYANHYYNNNNYLGTIIVEHYSWAIIDESHLTLELMMKSVD